MTLPSFSSSFATVCVVAAVAAVTLGCAVEPVVADEPAAASTDALRDANVKLPAGDPCRDVLAPLALGLADGAIGLDYARGVTVSLTSETDTRLYTANVAAPDFGVAYEIELDNDSHSLCLVLSVKKQLNAQLGGDRRTSMTRAERDVTVPVSISPVDDDCASTAALLGKAVAVSAVGVANVAGIGITLESATEERDYAVHVDGRSFVVDGHTFPNDYDFALTTSNDSASKCFVEELHLH